MAELRILVASLGSGSVVTYVRSGSLVRTNSRNEDEDAVRATLEPGLAEMLEAPIPVLLRTRGELRAVASRHPFAAVQPDPTKLHVMFLDSPPAAEEARLDPRRSPPDAFHALGGEDLPPLPERLRRSKPTIGYFERAL
jgi:uncharacterized protein (DUF1697 family)